MKTNLTLLVLLSFSIFYAQDKNENPKFNPQFADSLEADNYGMKSYTFVLLKKGKSQIKDKTIIQKCYESHLKNTFELLSQGEIILSGPFGNNENEFSGFFIFKSTDNETVNEFLSNDLAIKEGLLTPELIAWYGSAALPTYLIKHEEIWQVKP